jgi:hypothetical protein
MYDPDDLSGWYLTLAEAYVGHLPYYDPTFGARVVPIFKAIGRNIDILRSLSGAADRVAELMGSSRRQPDGILYELLVAATYMREGWRSVRLMPPLTTQRSADIEIANGNRRFEIECKRMGRSPYSDHERTEFWRLWGPLSSWVVSGKRSFLLEITFRKEVKDVASDYLINHCLPFLKSNRSREHYWSDRTAIGEIRWLDIEPLKRVLETDVVLNSSPRLFQLLIGEFHRDKHYSLTGRMKPWSQNARYISDMDYCALASWTCVADGALEAKGRHVLRHVAEANSQLSGNVPGIIHVGIESLDGDVVEAYRHPRILEKIMGFDPRGSQLSWIYCNYFVPQSPPDQSWIFDETVTWFGFRDRRYRSPLHRKFLVISDEVETEGRPHWTT